MTWAIFFGVLTGISVLINIVLMFAGLHKGRDYEGVRGITTITACVFFAAMGISFVAC